MTDKPLPPRRHRLKRFIGDTTDWHPAFVLEMPEGRLVHAGDGEPLIFHNIETAVGWVRRQAMRSSLEWDGTHF